ncbi:MAG: peptidylprolyl isomerase [Pirellulaceae bacterium]|nr:peptidylprolyl isomerase [Pirellulaceae bacterium]
MRPPRKFSFESLEPRELLAGDLATGANLLANGQFEDFSDAINGFVDDVNIPAWVVGDSVTSDQVRVRSFESRSEAGFTIDLDSTDDLDEIIQDIVTTPEENYLLTFDFRGRPVSETADPTTNDIEVMWEGASLGVFRAEPLWQTVTLEVTAGETSLSQLGFREVLSGNDGTGSFIDDVRLMHIENAVLGNASFETTENGQTDLLPDTEVPSWSAYGSPESRLLDIRNSPGSSSAGNQFLDLDSSAEHIDRIYQRFSTVPGNSYYVSFDLKTADGEPADQDELRVRWNDSFAGVFKGHSEWQSYGIFVEADSTESRLVFREPGSGTGEATDGNGPYLDNIRVFSVAPGTDSLTVDTNGPLEGRDSTAAFFEDSGPSTITNSALVLENTTTSDLTGAQVTISNLLDATQEFLTVETGTFGIQSSYNGLTGRLTLSGRATLAAYQSVLTTLTYENFSDTPNVTHREVLVAVEYNSVTSNPATITVSIAPNNDAPTIEDVADQQTTVLEPFTANITAVDPEGMPLLYDISASGTALASGDTGPTISQAGVIDWIPQQSGSAEITVTVTDDQGKFASVVFTIEALLDAPIPEDFVPFSGNRQLSNVVPSLRNNIYSAAPGMSIDQSKTYTATFQTDFGAMEVELFDDIAPETVNSFVNLAEDGYFDGLIFHRVLSLTGSLTEGFIAQGGDPLGTGSGGPGYNFGDELDPSLNFDRGGLLAMANTGVGNSSNGSQFFFNYDDKVQHLNQSHTIFGEISSGIGVLSSLADGVVIRSIGISEN